MVSLSLLNRLHTIHRAISGQEGRSEGEGFPHFFLTLSDNGNRVMVRRR